MKKCSKKALYVSIYTIARCHKTTSSHLPSFPATREW